MTRSHLIAMILGILLTSRLVGQDEHTSQVSVPGDPVVRQALTRAQEAYRNKDVERALKLWQDVLDRLSNKVIQVAEGPRRGQESERVVLGDVFHGVRQDVMDQILALPKEEFAQYQAIAEPRARDLLARGQATSDEDLLRLAMVRFFLTKSGKEAAIAWVDLLLRDGRFDEARVVAQRTRAALVKMQPDPALDAALVGRTAWALAQLGATAELFDLRASTPPQVISAKTMLAGRETTLEQFWSELKPRVSEQKASDSAPPVAMFRRHMWRRGITQNSNQGDGAYVFRQRITSPLVVHAPSIPLLDNGVVFLSDGRMVTARTLLTNEDVWPPVMAPVPELSGRRNRNLFFHLVLDGNLLFSYLEGPPMMQGQRALHNFEPIEDIPAHKLVAIDATSGRTVWSHHSFSTSDPEEREFLSKFTVNQPPLVVGDTLYVAGTVLLGVFHQWLCAFDRSTGQLKWKTYTGAGQMELNMFGNPIKEAIPGHLAENDGVLYYATNIGVIVAADAATGTIIWESAYEQEGIPSTDNPMVFERHPGWMPSRPAIHRGRLFVAPTDSLHLYVCDLKTGQLTNVPNASRDHVTMNNYFLGVHDGLLLVAGSHITAFDATTLNVKWRSVELLLERRNSSPVNGRPAIVGDGFYFTTVHERDQKTRLYRLDMKSGAVKEFQATDGIDRAGNLAITGDGIAVGSENAITVYFDLAEIQKRLEREVQAKPNNPALLLRLGDVQQREAQWSQALGTYERALKLALAQGPAGRQHARRASLALYNGWSAVARESNVTLMNGPSRTEERFAKALQFAETPEQKVRTLVTCLEWAHVQNDDAVFGRTAAALKKAHADQIVENYGRLIELLPEVQSGGALPAGLLTNLCSGVRAENQKRARDAIAFFHDAQVNHPDVILGPRTVWAWTSDRITALMKTFGNEVYAIQESAARALLAEASQKKDIDGLRAVLRHYPQSSVVEDAYLRLSRELLEGGNLREGLGEMQRYFARFGKVSAKSLVEYGRCLELQGARDSLLDVIRIIELRYPNAEIPVESGSERASEWAQRMRQRAELKDRQERAADPVLTKGLRQAWAIGSEQDGDEARLITPLGRARQVGTVFAFVEQELIGIDPSSGTVLWRKAANQAPKTTWLHDDRLIFVLEQDVVCLEMQTGKESWRWRAEMDEILDLAAGQGKAWVLLRTRLQNSPLTLRALDLQTGELVHETPISGILSASLSMGRGYVLVRGRERDRLVVCCDTITGTTLGNTFVFRSEVVPAFLTEDDLVVQVTGTTNRPNDMIRIAGKDPATQRERWSYTGAKGAFFHIGDIGDVFVFEISSALNSARGPGSSSSAVRKITGIDVTRGTEVFSATLDVREWSTRGVSRVGNRFFCNLRSSVKNGGLAAEKIKAFEAGQGRSPWATTEFTGANLSLSAFPTRDFVLVRKSISSRGAKTEGAELYLVDQVTGAVEEQIALGAFRSSVSESGMTSRGETLVVAAGSKILGLKGVAR